MTELITKVYGTLVHPQLDRSIETGETVSGLLSPR
jgi:hypothetical protein